MKTQIYIHKIKAAVEPYLESLRNFKFYISDPLFWLYLLVLFLILSRIWGIRKSRSFCFVVAILLLATTKVQNFIAVKIIKSGRTFDPIFIRIISLVTLGFVLFYYIFLKPES